MSNIWLILVFPLVIVWVVFFSGDAPLPKVEPATTAIMKSTLESLVDLKSRNLQSAKVLEEIYSPAPRPTQILVQRIAMRTDCPLLSRTFKYAPECGDEGVQVFPLLVTGTGRSGTEYTHKTLEGKGLSFSHDNQPVGKHGAASWPLAIRESDPKKFMVPYALPSFAAVQRSFLTFKATARFRVVVHQVRDTLKCIISRANRIGMMYAPIKYSNPTMFKELSAGTSATIAYPLPREMALFEAEKGNSDWTVPKRLRVALWHYVLWNEWLDKWSDATMRIEDLSIDISPLCRLANFTQCSTPNNGDQKSRVSTTTNSHKIDPMLQNANWTTLHRISPFMTERAKDLALSYGYSVII